MPKTPNGNNRPEPYVWCKDFEVLYKVIDDEHKGLFAAILAVEKNSGDAGILQNLCAVVSQHFRNEEQKMLANGWAQLDDHKKKHAGYEESLEGLSIPVPGDALTGAKDWLCDHIIGVDFGYRGKLPK